MGYQHEPLATVEPINDHDIELVIGKEHRERRRSLPRRIIRIALTIAAVLALINAYVYPISFMPSIRNSSPSSQVSAVTAPGDPKDGPFEFETGHITKCWNEADTTPIEIEHPHDSDVKGAAFPLITLDSDDVYFFARSEEGVHRRMTAGSITFKASDEVDTVTVSAEVYYRHRIWSELCTWEREDGGLGVGIYAPSEDHQPDPEEPDHPHHPHHPPHRRWNPQNNYRLVVTFPTKGDSPLKIKSLETLLPIYGHYFEDIGSKVEFETLSLRSSNSPIEAKSLTAGVADVRTSNSPITGQFNGTDSLTIQTVNAPILVQVAFTTSKGPDDEPAELVLSTLNAKLEASIELIASEEAGPGAFDVKTRTANAPLSVAFTSAPAGSELTYIGKTANGPAELVLHPSYEGTIEAQTAWFKATLNTCDEVEDPSGRGRKRELAVSNVGRNGFKAEVHWGEKTDDMPKGTVSLHTSLGPVEVTL